MSEQEKKMRETLIYVWLLRVLNSNPKLLTEGQINDMILEAIGEPDATRLQALVDGAYL